MDRNEQLALLAELIACHSPAGEEHEIEVVLRREFEATGAKVWQDDATNLIAHVPGAGAKVVIAAHKDEIGMIVRKVLPDGRLQIENCGGSWPWKYGEGPIDLIADDGSLVSGVLSVGSVHTLVGPVNELKRDRALTWKDVTVFTGVKADDLAARGVHVGSRAVVTRERKQLQQLGDFISSFALDDRMGLVALVSALRTITQRADQPALDLYFVASHGEEVGMLGAVRVAQLLAPHIFIALDTSPVVHDSPLQVDARPVVWYREATYNNKADCNRLLQLAAKLGFGAQPVLYSGSASDAGRVKQFGLAGRTVCFGFARDNSHGHEIAHLNSLDNVVALLLAYLDTLHEEIA